MIPSRSTQLENPPHLSRHQDKSKKFPVILLTFNACRFDRTYRFGGALSKYTQKPTMISSGVSPNQPFAGTRPLSDPFYASSDYFKSSPQIMQKQPSPTPQMPGSSQFYPFMGASPQLNSTYFSNFTPNAMPLPVKAEHIVGGKGMTANQPTSAAQQLMQPDLTFPEFMNPPRNQTPPQVSGVAAGRSVQQSKSKESKIPVVSSQENLKQGNSKNTYINKISTLISEKPMKKIDSSQQLARTSNQSSGGKVRQMLPDEYLYTSSVKLEQFEGDNSLSSNEQVGKDSFKKIKSCIALHSSKDGTPKTLAR